MSLLTLVGYIFAFCNPVVGGVVIGWIVWVNGSDEGLRIIVLSLIMFDVYAIIWMLWKSKLWERGR